MINFFRKKKIVSEKKVCFRKIYFYIFYEKIVNFKKKINFIELLFG